MKKIIAIITVTAIALNAYADNGHHHGGGNSGNGRGNGGGSQPSSGSETVEETATQTANLSLSDAIELTFTGTGTATGADVTMSFNNVNDYANGVESSVQALKVRSNKNFNVNVKANSSNFSYSGNATPAPTMPVSGVLDVKVANNSTGGNVGTGFDNYKDITSSSQNIISNGSRGGNQTFSVQYQATPGFGYPAGNYAIDVVYTATQL